MFSSIKPFETPNKTCFLLMKSYLINPFALPIQSVEPLTVKQFALTLEIIVDVVLLFGSLRI